MEANNTSQFRIWLIQFEVSWEKEDNLQKATEMVQEAAEKGANVIILPEMFICNYDCDSFSK